MWWLPSWPSRSWPRSWQHRAKSHLRKVLWLRPKRQRWRWCSWDDRGEEWCFHQTTSYTHLLFNWRHQLRFVTVVSVVVIVVIFYHIYESSSSSTHTFFKSLWPSCPFSTHTELLLCDFHQGHRAAWRGCWARRGCCGLCWSWHRAWHCSTVPHACEAQRGGKSQQREHYATIRHGAADVLTSGAKYCSHDHGMKATSKR